MGSEDIVGMLDGGCVWKIDVGVMKVRRDGSGRIGGTDEEIRLLWRHLQTVHV